jgi:hypothetical protein
MIIREHVFNNTPASDKCTVPGCGVAYAERLDHACQERMVPQTVPISGHEWPGGTYGVNCRNCGMSYCDFSERLKRNSVVRCPIPTPRRIEIDGIVIEGPDA